jgi:hypothetical protein
MERPRFDAARVGVGTILNLKNKRRIMGVTLTTLALAGGGGIAVASGVLSSGPPVPSAPASTAVSPQLTDHFAVLSGPTANVPADVRDVAVGLNEQFGLNTNDAREVAYSPTAPSIWVIPGSEGICIHVMTKVPSGACTSLKNALAGHLQIEVGGNGNGGGTVYGLAPNGNSKITVHDVDGSTEDLPVEQNVYIISKWGSSTVELADGAGQKQTISVRE